MTVFALVTHHVRCMPTVNCFVPCSLHQYMPLDDCLRSCLPACSFPLAGASINRVDRNLLESDNQQNHTVLLAGLAIMPQHCHGCDGLWRRGATTQSFSRAWAWSIC